MEEQKALDARTERRLREYLCFSHGHYGQYGDDGELQCGQCAGFGRWDYLRTPISELLDVLDKVGMERLVKLRSMDAEKDALIIAAQLVYDTFVKDEAQGYKSRDRQFAIEILGRALSTVPQPAARKARQDLKIVREVYQLKEEETSEIVMCWKCGGPMTLLSSYYGTFWGCDAYPACDGARRWPAEAGEVQS